MATTYYRVNSYADFKTLVDTLFGTPPPTTKGFVFFQTLTATPTNYIVLWFISLDGNFVISNVSPDTVPTGVFGFLTPGTFAADFPAAVALSSGVYSVNSPASGDLQVF